jgi:hypothetical protein
MTRPDQQQRDGENTLDDDGSPRAADSARREPVPWLEGWLPDDEDSPEVIEGCPVLEAGPRTDLA